MTTVELSLDWRDRAACRGVDPELFFPHRGENDALAAAKAICAECRVRDDCLEEAMADRTLMGVWGGLSERQRRTLRTKRRKAAA